MQRVALAISVVLGMLFAMHGWAAADDFFASSPGPLAESHAAIDTKDRCNDCHVDGSREVADQKCLGCHDHQDLGARINAGKGFHASSAVKGKPCKTCHADHKKRGFDIMGWKSVKGGEQSFDHDLTGWKLNGKHAATDCKDCHKAKNKAGLKTYMGTDTLCGSSGCHGNDQPHKFERRDMLKCERCHTESVWKPEKRILDFNHDDRKDAGMPILGSHLDVSCTKCHPKAQFNLPFQDPDSCGNSGCHKSTHDGHLFGKRECEWCHSPTFKSFKQRYAADMPFFDHSARTRFNLGAHAKIKCTDCHTKDLGEAKPVGACEQCHAKDNKHGERFEEFGSPPKCATCHPTTSWKPNAFNHTARAKFALTGKHNQITCRACHRGSSPKDFEKLPSAACMDCHAHKKVHEGKWKSGQCLNCHQGAGMIGVKEAKMTELYHGPSSKFPLVKGHKSVPCADCHTGRKKGTTSFEPIPTGCASNTKCHEDSLHKGTLSSDCEACHSPGIWDALRFDHDQPFPKPHKGEVDGFQLKGAHKDNDCESCHPQRDYVAAEITCAASGCHAEDDAHKGRLGTKCEQCHVETGDNIFNHNTMSKFRIDGGHLQVTCADCHPSVTFKPRPTNCAGCHPEPAVHRGQYGNACEQCHSTRTWEDIKPLHDVGDFALRGAHNNIACERCHRDNRPLAGSGNLCINCHRQDDIHSNGLSPRCGECHTQWSFAPARFDHSRVGCNLTGVHRTVACFDCHRNGNFAVIAPQCVNCHRDDAVARAGRGGGGAGTDPNNHITQSACAGCHSPNAWLPAPVSYGRESVCR